MKCIFNTISRKERQHYNNSGDFGHSLFKYYVDRCPGPNCVISPVSVFLCMSMLERGANGATKTELEKLLYSSSEGSESESQNIMKTLKESSVPGFILNLANGLFLQEVFEPLPDFVSEMRTDFNAHVDFVNFGSVEGMKKLNAWVKKETNGKVKEITDYGSDETVLALINAVYMKGKWSSSFMDDNTWKCDFHVSRSTTVKTDMMRQTNKFYYVRDEEANFSLAFLPYSGMLGKKSFWEMGILLPDDMGSDLKDFVQYLEQGSLTSLRQRARKENLDVWMPKFRVETSIDLIPILKLMGVEAAFSNRAQFPNIRFDTASI